MNNDGFDNYQKSQERQARYLAEADQHRLAQQGRTRRAINWRPHLYPAVAVVMIVLCVLVLFAARPALAHSAPQFEPGDSSMFHDAMLAFTLGRYYYGTGEYERALGYFEQSIELLPAVALEVAPQDYANIYRMLGKTQVELGLHCQALENFEIYVALAGDEADPEIVDAVSAVSVVYQGLSRSTAQ